MRRERPPAVVQQPAPPVAARSVRPPALTPELAAATAEFRRALVEHLGWTNQAAQAAAEEVRDSGRGQMHVGIAWHCRAA